MIAAIEDTIAARGQSSEQLGLYDQPEVGAGLLVEEDEGEHGVCRGQGGELLLPAHIVHQHGARLQPGPRQQESVYKFLLRRD